MQVRMTGYSSLANEASEKGRASPYGVPFSVSVEQATPAFPPPASTVPAEAFAPAKGPAEPETQVPGEPGAVDPEGPQVPAFTKELAAVMAALHDRFMQPCIEQCCTKQAGVLGKCQDSQRMVRGTYR